MQPVTIPEAEPFFHERGPVGALLLHGFTSTPFEVRELGVRLADAGITVWAPALPGHCTTPEDLANTTWRDWFDATLNCIEDLRMRTEEVFAIGSSAGAALALHASAHNSSIRGVVGLATIVRIRSYYPRLMNLLARVFPELPKRGGSSIRDPEARKRHPSYPTMPLKALVQLGTFLDHLVNDLPEITAPVLLVHARNDSVALSADVPFVLDKLGSRLKSVTWVENSDHIVTEDFDKEIVFEQAIDFVFQHSQVLSRVT